MGEGEPGRCSGQGILLGGGDSGILWAREKMKDGLREKGKILRIFLDSEKELAFYLKSNEKQRF